MTSPLTSFDSPVEQLRQQAIAPAEWLPLLASYQLIPNLLGESIIARAIAPIICTLEEIEQACIALYQQWGLETEAQQNEWRSYYKLTPDQFQQIATRNLRLEKFIESTWGHKLESYFLEHKHKFDRVEYSLIRHRDRDLMTELYFRIVEEEQSFAELAQLYSQGTEAQTAGRLGPFELGTVHPNLAKLLYYAPVGEVQPPALFGELYAIVRVEQCLPAQLNESMRHRLLQENFDAWFKARLSQLPQPEQVWMGVATRQSVADAQAA